MSKADAAYAVIQAWEDYQRRWNQNEAERANGGSPDGASMDADRRVLANAISTLFEVPKT